mmetsp:Transcript_97273/g.163599  ORF Transcript_97273/g.163599 Transcript_97273/m.163599 type:complete len:94 (-) Transcript_97273:85-366(-)
MSLGNQSACSSNCPVAAISPRTVPPEPSRHTECGTGHLQAIPVSSWKEQAAFGQDIQRFLNLDISGSLKQLTHTRGATQSNTAAPAKVATNTQ